MEMDFVDGCIVDVGFRYGNAVKNFQCLGYNPFRQGTGFQYLLDVGVVAMWAMMRMFATTYGESVT